MTGKTAYRWKHLARDAAAVLAICSVTWWATQTPKPPRRAIGPADTLAFIVHESINTINQNQLLSEPIRANDYKWGALPVNYFAEGQATPRDSAIQLKLPQHNITDSTINRYAGRIIHEHAHIHFHYLDAAKKEQFSQIVWRQLGKYESHQQQGHEITGELRKYSFAYQTIPRYKEIFGPAFADRFAEEVFAQYAGLLEIRLLHDANVGQLIPQELTPFYQGYINKSQLDNHPKETPTTTDQ